MLIEFDPSLVEIRKVLIHNVTTSMGGSIKFSEYDTPVDAKKRVKKVPFPMAVARLFIKFYERSNFYNPIDGAIMFYDGMAVAAEIAPMTVGIGTEHERDMWVPTIEHKVNEMLIDMGKKVNQSDNWYFDGTFVYRFNGDLDNEIAKSTPITSDYKFRTVNASCYHFSHFLFRAVETSNRLCLAYIASDQSYAITSPVWASLGGLNNSNSNEANEAGDYIGLATSLDRSDEMLAVNLNCIMYIAKSMTNIFGYRATYPLNLPQLMVQLRTVNLGALPKQVKALYPSNIPFTHLLAWLIGLHNNIISLEQVIELRKSLKYLTTKGTFDRKIENVAVYRQVDVPLVTLSEAEQFVENLGY